MRLASTTLFVWTLASSSVLVARQPGDPELQRVFTCPVHREVTEDAAGLCELCGRELVPILVRSAWSCPVHTVVSQSEAGSCPICGRTLYPVTEEVAYSCPMHPEVKEAAPGACPICNMSLEPSTSSRPHQDHNPKHGGIFFMAPDAWHHLEGVYPKPGVFRIYLFDNFSRPLDARAFRGRAVLQESFDAATREVQELEAYPLRASPDGAYLEAEVGAATWPREITAKIELERGTDPERFDFVFPDFTKEPDPSALPSRSGPVSGGVEIPGSPGEIVSAIGARNARLRELVAAGTFGELYVPALEAKDLAIALETEASSLEPSQRGPLRWALKQLVRAAWLLDDYGDLGNKQKVEEAYGLFDEAAEALGSLVGASR